MNQSPTLAFFDSGTGGLSLLEACISVMPGNYVYYADTANMPYGNKSTQFVTMATSKALAFLASYKPMLTIIACFSASSHITLDHKDKYSGLVSMLDLFDDKSLTSYKKVGIIGTAMTIKHGALLNHLSVLQPACRFVSQACPLLASAIENNQSTDFIQTLLKQYVQPLLDQSIEALLLGCTHYEHISSLIAHYVGPSVQLISTKKLLIDYLNNKHTITASTTKSTLNLISSQHLDSSYDTLLLALDKYCTIMQRIVI